MNYFQAEGISVGYGKKAILKNVSFSLPRGCILGVLGANGCGKTTLLKSICGILPHDGTCTLDGMRFESLSARGLSKLCSYIPQRSGISIEMSALDVVLMGYNPRLGLLAHPSEAMRQTAIETLSRVGLHGREHDEYLTLSEGQKQLCILARTLISESRLMLLDEPESALDFRFRYRMLEILRAEVQKRETSAIVTLHDGTLALNFCDRLLILSEGGVLGVVSPWKDPLSQTEEMLCAVYGKIHLQKCADRNGKEHLIMLKEDEL